LREAEVVPREAFFGGGPVTLRYRFRGDRPLDLRFEVVRLETGRTVKAWIRSDVSPGERHRLRWSGITRRGRDAADGRYEFRVGERHRFLRFAGRLVLRGHVFPVRGPHTDRGAVGEFGAPRSGGRIHQGFDIVAACGTPLVAARAGRVKKRAFDPVLFGNYVVINGREIDWDYAYVHLREPAEVREGEHVRTGERIGEVGDTGNAESVGCHLHFELRDDGRPFDPEPELRDWDRWS
jgi:Peptidase family M23